MSGAVHGTAIVVGTSGLLLIGASGAGKSRLALAFLAEARQLGQFAALIADDRVFLENHGGHVLARRPDSISGLIEIRGSGIGRFQSIEKALLHWAIKLIDPATAERLPEPAEVHEIEGGYRLPAISMQADLAAPYSAFRALILAAGAAKA